MKRKNSIRLGLLLATAMLVASCEEDLVGCRDICDPPRLLPTDSSEFVQELAGAYRRQDFVQFSDLLAPDFVFILDRSNSRPGATRWDAATERRIHARMFDPEGIQPTDSQLPPDLWLQSVTITLSQQTTFAELPDLYSNYDPPGPLDPARWIARGASYDTDLFFALQGDADYQITGRAYFVVIEDRTKQVSDPGKFLLFQWEDLGRNPSAETEERSWTGMKTLYN